MTQPAVLDPTAELIIPDSPASEPTYSEPPPDAGPDYREPGPETPAASAPDWQAKATELEAKLAQYDQRFTDYEAKLQQPIIEQEQAAAAAEIEALGNDLRALALPEEQVQERLRTYQAGRDYRRYEPRLQALATQAYALELAEQLGPDVSYKDVKAFVAQVSQYPHVDLMQQAAKMWVDGRRTTAAAARTESGAERIEGTARSGGTGGISKQEFIDRWGDGSIATTPANAARARQLTDEGYIARAR